MQRYIYGGAARARRHSIVKFFTKRVSPNKNSIQLLYLYIYFNYLFKIRHLLLASPLSSILYMAILYSTYIARQLNKLYTPQEAYNKPFIPYPTQQPRLTYIVFRFPLYFQLGIYIGALGQGPRTRYLVLYLV